MHHLNHLKKHGLQARLKEDGSMRLSGLSSLDEVTRTQLVRWAKAHREKILEELKQPVVIELDEQQARALLLQDTIPASPHRSRRKHLTPELLRAWKTARPWILNHLQELQAKGWTRKQLFQAGRYSFPHGLWGPAWSPNWLRPGVEVSIDSDGALRWAWTDAVGRQVSQAAGPKP